MNHPTNTTVELYSSAVLRCSATSYSNLTITWIKAATQTLPITAIVKTIELPNNVTSILTITRLLLISFGQYYCVAKNNIGETHSTVSDLKVKGKLILYVCMYCITFVIYI